MSSWPLILTFCPHKLPEVHPWGCQLLPTPRLKTLGVLLLRLQWMLHLCHHKPHTKIGFAITTPRWKTIGVLLLRLQWMAWQLLTPGGRPLVFYFWGYTACYIFVTTNHIQKLAYQFPSRNSRPNISWHLCCLNYSACYIFVAKIHTNPHTNISPMQIAMPWFPEVGEFQEHVPQTTVHVTCSSVKPHPKG